MKLTEQFLKKILVDSELVSQEDFKSATKEAQKTKESLEKMILEKGLVSEEELGQLIAEEIDLPSINLKKTKISKEVLNIVPEIVAKKQEIIVFDKTKEGLKVAMAHPENLEIREFIERKTGETVIPYFTTSGDISEALKHYKKEIKGEFEELIGKSLAEYKETSKKPESLKLPIIKITELILNYAYENRASDIHIEPYEGKTILRYRIDGILHDILVLPKEIHNFLVSRIKILSKLRTDVHEAAQDGHFSLVIRAKKVDVRVSIVPVQEGEKIVLRLLSGEARRFDLEELGLSQLDLQTIRENMKKAWGMLLVSGPTGCGKTTTLYAMLKILNTRDVNICTIEDPIEYDVEGVNQIQVNTQTNLTFALGLRAIIRQDPDIIMVGEVRDTETAKLAINSAMTGHLILSTFHATDTSTTLPRLLDMEIEAFLIASTVNVIISQRLVRKICPKCIESYEISFSELSSLVPKEFVLRFAKKENKIRLFRGKGCSLCQQTGYLDRIGIFEVLEISDSVKKLIMEKASAAKIRAEAKKAGMTTMVEDGLKKVESGITTIEEILRTIK